MTRSRRTGVRWGVAAVLSLAVAGGGLAACSKHHGSEAEFCRQVRTIPSLQGVLSGYQSADAEELHKRLITARDAYADLKDAAPDPIDGDVSELVSLVDAVIDAVGQHPSDASAAAAAIRTATKGHPGAAASSKAVATYASSHCKVTLS